MVGKILRKCIGISRCVVPRDIAAVEESPVKFIDVYNCSGLVETDGDTSTVIRSHFPGGVYDTHDIGYRSGSPVLSGPH